MLNQFKDVFTEIEHAFNSMVLIGGEDEPNDVLNLLLDDMEEEEEEEKEKEEEETGEMNRLACAMHELQDYCKQLPIPIGIQLSQLLHQLDSISSVRSGVLRSGYSTNNDFLP